MTIDNSAVSPPGSADEGVGERFRDGDERALEEIYRRWSPVVFTLALRSLGDRTDAEDVTQKTFVSAWGSRASFDPAKARVSTWLIAIARRRIADTHEARARIGALQRELERYAEPTGRDAPEVDIGDTILRFLRRSDPPADRLTPEHAPRHRQEPYPPKPYPSAIPIGGEPCRIMSRTSIPKS